MQTTPDSLKNKTDQAAQGLNHLINNASDALHPAIDGLTAKAHSTVDSLASAANHGIDNFDARTEQLSKAKQRCQNDIADKFMKSLVTLLAAIDKNLVIEGVETSAQLEFLRANNADYVQGYYLAKPMVKELQAFANSGALLMLNEAHKVPTAPCSS